MNVMIIGAGIGGLCLAQGLRHNGIHATVYERDDSPYSRHQGYRISLKPSGADALRECLPSELFDLVVATSIRTPTRMVFLDHGLRPARMIPLPHRDGFGVNRLTLREILLARMDTRFGKALTGYQSTPDGHVVARFADGSSATGDLLIGADGTGSAVRRQLIPEAVIDELHWIIYGRTPFGEWMPDVVVDTFNRIHGPDGVGTSVATCRAREPVADAARRLAPWVTVTDIPDYFSWTLPLADPRLFRADPVALREAAAAMVTDWHPAIRRLIAEADVSGTFSVCVTSARPVSPWSAPNVTLLGDAVHTMSPGRGDGANVALQDAATLLSALRGAADAPLAPALRTYEREMLDYGFQAVASSRDNPFLSTVGRPRS